MSDENGETLEEASDRYLRALHAVQSGIKIGSELGGEHARQLEPKHLRVGINSALVEVGVVFDLLIKLGLTTKEELFVRLADAMEAEQGTYEHRLGVRLS